MSHHRALPRDFFNEAKLLKCLGQLEICILDKMANGLNLISLYDGGPFKVEQDPADGSLRVVNYAVVLNGDFLHLRTPLNARENYPLIATYRGEEYYVFDESGKFMPNFGVKNED